MSKYPFSPELLDLTNAKKITDSVLKSQIQRIYKDKETAFVDTIIVVRNGDIVVVVKKA
jgi:dsDNA-specific endonuclease/ATPase MutS2